VAGAVPTSEPVLDVLRIPARLTFQLVVRGIETRWSMAIVRGVKPVALSPARRT